MGIAIPGGMTSRTAALLALLPTLLLASVARADLRLPKGDTFLSFGPLLSLAGQEGETQAGLGAEITFNRFDKLGGVGAFAQVQAMEGGYARLCGGGQLLLTALGVELGLMHQTGSERHVATTGLHIAPFLAFVYGSVGVRFGIPFAGAEEPGRPRHGKEIGFVLTAKLPFHVDSRGGLEPVFQ
jgi:hypothetical protein